MGHSFYANIKKTYLRPKQRSFVLWGNDALCNRLTIITEKDPYFGRQVCLSGLTIFRDEIDNENSVNAELVMSSVREDDSIRDLPGDKADLTSQTTRELTDLARRLGLKWAGNSVFQNEVKKFSFPLSRSALSFTEQAILLARKIDENLIREDMRHAKAGWLTKGVSYQIPFVHTGEYGRESYFSYVLREQLEIPIEDV